MSAADCTLGPLEGVYVGTAWCGCIRAGVSAAHLSRDELAEAIGEMVLGGLSVDHIHGPAEIRFACPHMERP